MSLSCKLDMHEKNCDVQSTNRRIHLGEATSQLIEFAMNAPRKIKHHNKKKSKKQTIF